MSNKNPVAFATINELKSFWSGKHKFTPLVNKLGKLIPDCGPVSDAANNPALDKFRVASTCYYDLYNNGLCNSAEEFRKVFGFSGLKSSAEKIDARMTEIVLAAAAEQHFISPAGAAKLAPAWTPLEFNEKEAAHKVKMIKDLAADLDTPGKGNFGMTLDSLKQHVEDLLRDEAKKTGRGTPERAPGSGK